jgi:predicted transcriptional regulator
MTTLKYLGLPDLTGRAPGSLTPKLGHLDADSFGGYELVFPALHQGLHAWIRGAAPSDPTWTELQHLTNAVRGFSREVLIHGQLRQHVLHGPRREPLLFRLDARRRRPYQYAIHTSLRESMATWLRTSDDNDVLLAVFPPEADTDVNAERELVDALQQLSTDSPADPSTPAARHVPAESEASAAARRDAIAGWLTAAEAGERIPGPTRAPAQRASRMARLGQLFGVWVPEERAYRYAPWQFMQSGLPSPILPEILALMRGPNGVSGGERTSGWEELEWFLRPHARADGRTPAQLLATDPPAILKLAHEAFDEGADDARW